MRGFAVKISSLASSHVCTVLIGHKSMTILKLLFFCFVLQLRREGRVANVADVVHRGQRVKIKVLSMTGSKISLSMKVRNNSQFCKSKLLYVLLTG